jgi:hypothetical protein
MTDFYGGNNYEPLSFVPMTANDEKELAEIAEAAIKAAERERDGDGGRTLIELQHLARQARSFIPTRTPAALPTTTDKANATRPFTLEARPGMGRLWIRDRRGVRPFRPNVDNPEDAFEI